MGLVVAGAILIGAFYLLAVITEDFFVPSIDIITEKLKLSSDAAGATFLAAGSSAPEFFTSLIAILGLAGANNSDIGAGTIVGSAIFNVLVIVGVAAMFRAVTLQWKPVIRDMLFYIVTIILLLFTFLDGKITLIESVIFIGTYVLYVFFVVNWRKWLKYHDPKPIDASKTATKNVVHKKIRKAVSIIVPDPYKKRQLFLVTFLLCIFSIAGLSWFLVEQIVVIADSLNINSTFLALTVLAAGTSVPDLIGSVVVAKQGRGDMAVGNAIGSNIFDILIGLGLAWFIALLVNPGPITVGTENLFSSIFLLFATVVAILFLLIVRNWRIGHKSGLILIGLYLAYCVYIVNSL